MIKTMGTYSFYSGWNFQSLGELSLQTLSRGLQAFWTTCELADALVRFAAHANLILKFKSKKTSILKEVIHVFLGLLKER